MRKRQFLLHWKILTYYENLLWEKKWVLVFLHGWMQDGTSFSEIFQILEEKNIPYVSLDLPGFGASQFLHDNMTIEEYWEVVISFIEKLWLKNPTLIWHSFGGRISIYLGSFYKNIDKIVLLCAAGIVHKISFPKYIIVKTGKIILSFPGLRTLGRKIKEWFSSPDLRNAGKMEKIFRNTISLDLQKNMKKIKYKTLMIWGKNDDVTPVSEWEIIHKHIKKSKLYILDWTHFVHQEQATKITKMILDFTQK